MAHDSSETTPGPYMDRLTHAVLKEASKSLKYYIDIKHRENAFVLNTNSPVSDLTPLKTRIIHKAVKKHPSLNNSSYTDRDIKSSLPSLQQKSKLPNISSTSPEKQICRNELHFHMRSYNFSTGESSKFSSPHLKTPIRSTSSFYTNRDIWSRPIFPLKRHEKNQLIENTADILASMMKSRRSLHKTNLSAGQVPSMNLLQRVNVSPHPIDEQSSITHPTIDLKTVPIQNEKSKRKNSLTKATSMTKKSKLINKGTLCEYKITVTTGNCKGASTNASIRIRLYGTIGHTMFYELVHSETHPAPFLKDQTDLFTIQTYHIGELTGVTIGHNRKDIRASWFLKKISIDDSIRHITFNISCNAWLSIKSNDKKTMRNFPVTSLTPSIKQISSNEYQEGHSTILSNSETTPNTSTNHKKVKKNRKQKRTSISSATTDEKPPSTPTNANTLTQSPPLTTLNESVRNQDESVLSSSTFAPHICSPILSSTISDTEIQGNMTSRSRSTTPTPSPTLNQSRLKSLFENDTLRTNSANDMFTRYSIDFDRPPTRLEKRTSPEFLSPER